MTSFSKGNSAIRDYDLLRATIELNQQKINFVDLKSQIDTALKAKKQEKEAVSSVSEIAPSINEAQGIEQPTEVTLSNEQTQPEQVDVIQAQEAVPASEVMASEALVTEIPQVPALAIDTETAELQHKLEEMEDHVAIVEDHLRQVEDKIEQISKELETQIKLKPKKSKVQEDMEDELKPKKAKKDSLEDSLNTIKKKLEGFKGEADNKPKESKPKNLSEDLEAITQKVKKVGKSIKTRQKSQEPKPSKKGKSK